MAPSVGSHLRVILGANVGMFLYFLKPVQHFFMKSRTDILAITVKEKEKLSKKKN